MRRAVYAGGFDPITNGHLWMIKQGAKLFDELVVAIGINVNKEYSFSIEERLGMLRDCTKMIKNVRIASFEGRFLVEYAKQIGAEYLLRGIRSNEDYEYERVLTHVNHDINRNMMTVFFIPPMDLTDISSSLVKSLVGSNGWETQAERYLPEPVHKRFVKHFSKK